MGLTTSEDLLVWKRYPGNPVVRIGPGGCDSSGAHVMAPFSRDLLHGSAHPEPRYRAEGHPGGLDATSAHKVSLVYRADIDTFYLSYCAVGNRDRGIGRITSRPV